ncbi:MAG TPA: hypothetical protein PLB32_22195, partial [Acidobacteriota bacterium]|nr:hypothetical protein [Acidobacteriota bacterium]
MKGKGSDHKAKSNHAMHADLLQRAALMKGGLVALRKPVMAAVGLFTMKVNFEDINRNREKLFQRRVDLSGFLSGGKWFYVLIDAAPPSAPSWDNPFVVVLDNNLHNSLCESEASPLCGSMVQYAGWATLTGV